MNGRRLLLFLACLVAACRGPSAPWSDAAEGVDLSFVGHGSFAEKELIQVVASELAGLDGSPVDKAAVDDAAYAIELFYRGKGFPDVNVDYEFTPGDPARASFRVEEGPLVTVESFEVEGVRALAREDLEGLLEDAGPGSPYSLARARGAMAAIRAAYLARGFLDVRVAGPRVERLEDAGVALTAEIDEGPRFVVRGMEFEGGLPKLDNTLEDLASSNIGRTYTPHLAFKLRSYVIEGHARNGFPDCAVETETDRNEETGDVHLRFRIDPGVRVEIAAVEVVGNEDVHADRIRGRIDLEPGDRYDPRKVQESFRKLYATGLFDSVRIFLKEGEGEQRTLVAEVVESPTLEVFVEPGWGSYVGPLITFGVDERNVFSSGRRARIQAHLSRLDSGAQLLLSDPWLFDAAITGEASIFYNDRVEPSFAYTEVGFNLGVRKDWTRHLSTTLGYELSFTETRDVQIGGVIPPNIAQDVDIGSLTFSIVRNTRDNVLLPRKGSVVRFYSNFAASALGSEVNLFENGINLSRVISITDKTQVAGSARVSVVAPFGGTTAVPLTRRQFNGGENTVRSFQQSELGPKDVNGEPIGGEAMNILSVELRRKLSGNFSGALFFDTGNVILDFEDYLDFADFRSGIGVGLRYLLPIGPVRLDYAVNPDPRPDEDEWVLHFAVGLAY